MKMAVICTHIWLCKHHCIVCEYGSGIYRYLPVCSFHYVVKMVFTGVTVL